MSEDYTNLKYELIPYDNFVGSDAFDFNKTIYDLNSQIELLSSQADNLDYIVAVASGIACSILDILWVGEFDLAHGHNVVSDKVDTFVKKTAEMIEDKKFDDVKSAVKALEKRFPIPSDGKHAGFWRWFTTSSARFCSPSYNCGSSLFFIDTVYGKVIRN